LIAADLRRRAGGEALVLGFFVAASMAWWWPLPLHLRTHQLEQVAIDSAYNQWILGWGSHAIVHEPWNYFGANAYHPHTDVLAWGDNLFGLALLTVPLKAMLGLVGAYNVLLLASTALTGYFTYRLTRELGAIRSAAVLGGVVASLSSARVYEHGHLQILSTQWIPLVFLCAERARRSRRVRDAVGLGGSVLAVLTTNLYLTIFTALAFTLWLLVRAALRQLSLRWIGVLGAAWLAAVALALPLYLPSMRVQQDRDVVRPLSEQQGSAVEAFDPRPPPGAPVRELGSWLGLSVNDAPIVPPPNYATPGLVSLTAIAVAIVWRLRRRKGFDLGWAASYGTIALFAMMASFGPSIRWRQRVLVATNPVFHLPYRFLPGYDALRVPIRWLLLVALAGGVVAAGAVTDPLAALRRRAVRVGLVALFATGVVVELSAAPWRLSPAADSDDHPSMIWLADQPADVIVVELPITGDVSSAVTQEIEGRRLLLSATHLRRRVNGGISPYIPATYGDRVEVVNSLGVDPQALAYLREWQVDYVLFEPADQARYGDRMRTPDEVEADLDGLAGLRRVETFADAIVYRVERR
jgi:hypothetical protein